MFKLYGLLNGTWELFDSQINEHDLIEDVKKDWYDSLDYMIKDENGKSIKFTISEIKIKSIEAIRKESGITFASTALRW